MNFLVDAQLPPALCNWLRSRGHSAVHVSDVGLLSAADVDIARRAEAEAEVLMTKDEDFVTLRLPDRFSLLWLRCGNVTNRALTAWLDPRWTQVEGLLIGGDRFIEVR